MNMLQKGTLAYFDTFYGLVKVKVLSIDKDGQGTQQSPTPRVKFQVTAEKGAYRKGEILESSSYHVIPRSCVRIRGGSHRISNQYLVG
jgi:hypothetical protein